MTAMMAITATAMALAKPRDSVVRRAGAADGEALARLIEERAIALGGKPRDGDGLALVELGDADIDTLVAEAREGMQGFLQLRLRSRNCCTGRAYREAPIGNGLVGKYALVIKTCNA